MIPTRASYYILLLLDQKLNMRLLYGTLIIKSILIELKKFRRNDPIPSYVSRCKLIHLETLFNRRSRISVLVIYKLICGLIDCPYLLSLIGFNIPTRCLRHNEMFNIPLHRRNYSMNEPIVRSLKELNNISLLKEIDFSLSIVYFVKSLDEYYW